MLEDIEMRFILTDTEGKLLGCYSELENAEMDAKDIADCSEGARKVNIYEIMSAQKIGEPFLQNIYELRKSFPECTESEEKSEDTAE